MDPAKDPSKDLLSAALDICGLDFNFEEVSDEAPQSYSSESYEEPISESPVHHQHHNYASQPLQPTVVTPARSGSVSTIQSYREIGPLMCLFIAKHHTIWTSSHDTFKWDT